MTSVHRWTISKRLLLISGVFTLPVMIMLGMIVRTMLANSGFTGLEVAGTAYEAPLVSALAHVADHERSVALGDTAGASAAAASARAAFLCFCLL